MYGIVFSLLRSGIQFRYVRTGVIFHEQQDKWFGEHHVGCFHAAEINTIVVVPSNVKKRRLEVSYNFATISEIMYI